MTFFLKPAFYRALALAAFFIGGWNVGVSRVEARWNVEKIARLKADREAEAAARKQEQDYATKLQEAENAATKRNQALKLEADAARAAVVSLRDAIAEREHQLSESSQPACRQTAATALTLLGVCAAEYREMAERADGHASDVRTLSEAWPGQMSDVRCQMPDVRGLSDFCPLSTVL